MRDAHADSVQAFARLELALGERLQRAQLDVNARLESLNGRADRLHTTLTQLLLLEKIPKPEEKSWLEKDPKLRKRLFKAFDWSYDESKLD